MQSLIGGDFAVENQLLWHVVSTEQMILGEHAQYLQYSMCLCVH